jgi:hypothetical protein
MGGHELHFFVGWRAVVTAPGTNANIRGAKRLRVHWPTYGVPGVA